MPRNGPKRTLRLAKIQNFPGGHAPSLPRISCFAADLLHNLPNLSYTIAWVLHGLGFALPL